MQREEVKNTFQLGHSWPQLKTKSGIRTRGTSACKRLLEYAQNPSAKYKIVRDFIFSNFYNNRVEFDCNELSRLDARQMSDCLLALRLKCVHPEHFNNVIHGDLRAWKLLEVAHANRSLESTQGALDFSNEVEVTSICANSPCVRIDVASLELL